MIYNLCTVKSVSRVVWRTGPNVERSVENWAQRLEECGEVGPTSRGVWRPGPNVERGVENWAQRREGVENWAKRREWCGEQGQRRGEECGELGQHRGEECGELGQTSRGVWRTGPNVERGVEKTRKKEVQNICHDHYPYTRRLSSRTDNIIMKAAHSTVRLKMFHFAALIFGPARTRKLRDKNIFLLPLLLLLLLLYRFPIALFPAE